MKDQEARWVIAMLAREVRELRSELYVHTGKLPPTGGYPDMEYLLKKWAEIK